MIYNLFSGILTVNDYNFIVMQKNDLDIVQDIYNYYIENSTATFHTQKLSIEQLKEFVTFSKDEIKKLKQITAIHPMQVTPYYISLIDWSNPSDPIRKMVIPSLSELDLQGSYDTSGEAESTKLRGLQHKYSETALILATNRCATYCRLA